MFQDEAEVIFRSGNGGNGSVGFHREKHVPRGGPNGADGGRGGSVLLRADRSKRTLIDFRYQHMFAAESGEPSHGNKHGGDSPDLVVRVPVGTVVRDALSGSVIADLSHDGQTIVVCKGGSGGHGNLHYTSSVRQAPRFAEIGEPGVEINAKLELKLVADVGLVGLPNAGKSTLISTISAAKAEIGDFPFTTIVPNLGVVAHRGESFTVADLPGLIEGAAEGKGLGHRFLRHAERVGVLIHLVECAPIDQSEPLRNFLTVERELKQYSIELYEKPRIVAITKSDVSTADHLTHLIHEFKYIGVEASVISSVSGQGIDELLDRVPPLLETRRSFEDELTLVPAAKQDDRSWGVRHERGKYLVEGVGVERMASMTDLSNDEAIRYLHRRLQRIGVIDRLREMGADDGDTIAIAKVQFEFSNDS